MGKTLNKTEKQTLLRRRGFTVDDIQNNLNDYCTGKKGWIIKTITPKDAADSNDEDVLMRLFEKDSLEGVLLDDNINAGFDWFCNPNVAKEISPAVLEPYIARFVMAVNKCGAYTSSSCDGWHSSYDAAGSRPMRLWMTDRYSAVWLWLIAELVFGETWKGKKIERDVLNWSDQWEPNPYENESDKYLENMQGINLRKCLMIYIIKDEAAISAYEKINGYAEVLEQKCEDILKIKQEMTCNIKDNSCDIEAAGFLEIRRIMYNNGAKKLERILENGKS